MSSFNVLFNRKSFIPFNPNAIYKITCVLRADTATFTYAPNLTVRVGVIGSKTGVHPVPDTDLLLSQNTSYGVSPNTLSSNIAQYGYWHCFSGTLNTACPVANTYYTLTGYTSNAGLGTTNGTTGIGTLTSPGSVYRNTTVAQATTNFITPIILVYNSGAQAVKVAFDSLMIEEVTGSMSAAGLVTGAITSQIITVGGAGAGSVIIDGGNSNIRIRNNGNTLDQITIGKTGASAAGIVIKNAAGVEVFKVDDTGASISNIQMGTGGGLTWNAAGLTGPLTNMNATGIYTGTLTANQINSQLITSAAISGATVTADKIAAGNITVGLNVSGASGQLKSSNYIQDNTGWVINSDGTFQFNQNTNNFLRYMSSKFSLGAGKPTYASTTPGLYISNTGGEYFSIGDANNYLKYDGTTLSLAGNLDMSKSAAGENPNLFRDFNSTASYYGICNNTSRLIDVPSKVPGASVLRCWRAAADTDAFVLYGDMYIISGKYYTISFWYKGSVVDNIHTGAGSWLQQHGGSGATYTVVNGGTLLGNSITTSWQYKTYTILAGGGNSYAHIVFRPLATVGGGTIDYTGIKVEEGQIASQWTMAPEDLTTNALSKSNLTFNPIVTGGAGGITLGSNGFILAGSKTTTGSGNGLLYGKDASGNCLFNVGKGAHGDFASGPHMSWSSTANAGAGELEIVGTITGSTIQTVSGVGTGVPGTKMNQYGMIVHDGTYARVKLGDLSNL